MFKEKNNLIVPVVTPMYNSKIDIISLEKIIDFLIENKVDAIFILGTTGEFQRMTLEEKIVIIEIAYEKVKGRVSLLIGISSNTIEEMKKIIQAANHFQSTALVLAPLFGGGSPEDKINIVLKHSSLPVIFYNNPDICGNNNLDIDIVKKFSNNKMVVGIKDSSGDEDYFKNLCKLSSKSFLVFQGSETQYMKLPKKSFAGLVSGSANVDPIMFKRMLENPTNDIFTKVMSLKEKIKPKAIKGIKKLLVKNGVIMSDELYE